MATDLIGTVDLPLVAQRPRDFKGKVDPDWCPGCGDFGAPVGPHVSASVAARLPSILHATAAGISLAS